MGVHCSGHAYIDICALPSWDWGPVAARVLHSWWPFDFSLKPSYKSVSSWVTMTQRFFFYPQPFSFPPSSTFSRYRISYRRPQDFFTRSTSVSSTITQTTIRFLQFGSSYNFSIRAEVRFSYCFSTLFGAYSDPVNATTMETGRLPQCQVCIFITRICS